MTNGFQRTASNKNKLYKTKYNISTNVFVLSTKTVIVNGQIANSSCHSRILLFYHFRTQIGVNNRIKRSFVENIYQNYKIRNGRHC